MQATPSLDATKAPSANGHRLSNEENGTANIRMDSVDDSALQPNGILEYNA